MGPTPGNNGPRCPSPVSNKSISTNGSNNNKGNNGEDFHSPDPHRSKGQAPQEPFQTKSELLSPQHMQQFFPSQPGDCRGNNNGGGGLLTPPASAAASGGAPSSPAGARASSAG